MDVASRPYTSGMEDGPITRRRIRITGIVQGVGLRPFVWRRATRLELAGWVENGTEGVTVEVEGPECRVASFLDGLAAAAPPLARVDAVEATTVDVQPAAAVSAARFVILESGRAGRRAAVIPPDVAPCAACLAEVHDPTDRRHRYPFTNCTDCGPRFTIIERLPYDRVATTMRDFTMCPRCAAEYTDPRDRRFHAVPNACPKCGPVIWFAAMSATPDAVPIARPVCGCRGDAALAAARQLLAGGGILAVKGVGGFHLACDATNATAVATLRDRKHRVGKPLALLVADVAAARSIARVSDQEARLLEGRERPIVLLGKRETTPVAAKVAPGNDFLGVMLPPSPLHHLLCDGLPPLVLTSGNLAEEPIAHDNADAVRRLSPLADGFLLHDREIRTACDDSVVRCVAGAALPIRRSRGYAPLPLRLPRGGPPVLAVGGELKAALCLAVDDTAVMSQHIGDMGSLETLQSLEDAADHLCSLLGIEPAAVVADLHPGYMSTAWAFRRAAERRIPFIQVPHHEAHVAAILAEHGFGVATPPPGFIGVCFDGTGYGRDGTIQGGEFFTVTSGRLSRAAHLRQFSLPGGDACIRHPWRTALAVLHAAGVEADDALPSCAAATPTERAVVARQLDHGIGCAATSSMGRLFDAVASLIGARHSVSYEAEAALNLEALAAAADAVSINHFRLEPPAASDGPLVVDWRPVVADIVAAVHSGRPAGGIAAAFHDAVVAMIVAVCTRLRPTAGPATVGLTGGVVQNALLAERSIAALSAAGFDVLVHHAVPPNDGGLALGQAVLARSTDRT